MSLSERPAAPKILWPSGSEHHLAMAYITHTTSTGVLEVRGVVGDRTLPQLGGREYPCVSTAGVPLVSGAVFCLQPKPGTDGRDRGRGLPVVHPPTETRPVNTVHGVGQGGGAQGSITCSSSRTSSSTSRGRSA